MLPVLWQETISRNMIFLKLFFKDSLSFGSVIPHVLCSPFIVSSVNTFHLKTQQKNWKSFKLVSAYFYIENKRVPGEINGYTVFQGNKQV